MLNVWLIKLSKIHNEKVMSPDYFTYIQKCQNEHWHQDISSVSESIFFKQLKPSIQEELLDYINKHIYEEFEEFFEGHEHKFIRECVKNMRFQIFQQFPPYTEKYKDDNSFIPPVEPTNILEKGRIPYAVFFIIKGEVYAGNKTGKYCYFQFREKSVFGEAHLLTGTPFSYSIFHYPGESVSAYVIPDKVFIKICEKFPRSYKILVEKGREKRKVYRKYKYEILDQFIEESISNVREVHGNFADKMSAMYKEVNINQKF